MLQYRGSPFYFSAGAQIIDMMLLVIDVTKGIQTQTAEVKCIRLISFTRHGLIQSS